MTVNLFLPYTLVQANGTQTATTSPTVDAIPTSPTTTPNVVLTTTVGTYVPGAYQYVAAKSRWQFLIDYQTICNQLFGVSNAFLCTPNAGDNLLPIGTVGIATVHITRNGVALTQYTVGPTGIVLTTPAAASDMYLVLLSSPLNAMTAFVVDAPIDGNAYARNSGGWELVANETNEGSYVGN